MLENCSAMSMLVRGDCNKNEYGIPGMVVAPGNAMEMTARHSSTAGETEAKRGTNLSTLSTQLS